MAKKDDLVSFEPLKTFAKAYLREDSKMREMILREREAVTRPEMIVKLDMYNRMLAYEPKR